VAHGRGNGGFGREGGAVVASPIPSLSIGNAVVFYVFSYRIRTMGGEEVVATARIEIIKRIR
jgi:hypothetical protein